MQPTPSAAFSAVSNLTRRSDTTVFDGAVHPGWTIAGKPNGGYLLAMLCRAAVEVGGHPDVMAASAHYLSPPDAGPVEVHAEVVRPGRSASQVRCRMFQGGSVRVEALVTTGTVPDVDSKPYWTGGVPDHDIASFDRCVRLPGRTPTGMTVALLDVVDLRLDEPSLAFAAGRPRGLGELRGWLALPDGEDFDPLSLVFAVDAFPPATFDIEPTGWVPTFELTVYVRAHAVSGPVQVLQRAVLVDGERVDEICHVWDSSGRLVAHGTQLAGVRLG